MSNEKISSPGGWLRLMGMTMFVGAVLMGTARHAAAATPTVTVTTDTDVVDGDTTDIASLIANKGADGEISLREAVTAANGEAVPSDVDFDPALMTATITLNELYDPIVVSQSMTISGLGADYLAVNGNDATRLFLVSNTGSAAPVTISGLTLKGGYDANNGGAIAASYRDVTISACTISGNNSPLGGAIYADHSKLTVTDCNISGNSAGTNGGGAIGLKYGTNCSISTTTLSGNHSKKNGGALYLVQTPLVLTDVVLQSNESYESNGGAICAITGSTLTISGALTDISLNTSYYSGGGIFAYKSDVSVTGVSATNAAFKQNYAGKNGGAISISGTGAAMTSATLTLSGAILDDNEAFYRGGGVYIHKSTGNSLAGNTFKNHYADFGGALFLYQDADVSITGTSSFDHNKAEYSGGAISVLNSKLTTVTGATFLYGEAKRGAAIHIKHGNDTSALNNCTFNANDATEYGGAIAVSDATITITGSSFDTNTANTLGGGLYLNDATVTVSDSTISNSAALRGGGAYVGPDATLNITGLTTIISDNTATVGGGVALYNSSVTITDATLSGNEADYGGSIFADNSYVGLDHSKVTLSYAYDGGGGIFLSSRSGLYTSNGAEISENNAFYGAGIAADNSQLTINDSIISQNIADGEGGGVFVNNLSNLRLAGTDITGNQASDGGGGVCAITSGTSLNDATITGNSARYGGGAYIQNAAGRAVLYKVTMNMNSAEHGAGMSISDTYASVYNSVFSNNIADNGGGGIEVLSASVQVANSTISGNQAPTGGGITISGFYCAVDLSGTEVTNNSADYGGGAALGRSALFTTTYSYLTGNTAQMRGGGVYSYRSTVYMAGTGLISNYAFGAGGAIAANSNSFIGLYRGFVAYNGASDRGGGIDADSSALYLSQTTVDSNNLYGTSAPGGGIYANRGYTAVVDSTISNNYATGAGGGVAVFYANNAVALISNSTISGNQAGEKGGGMVFNGALGEIHNSTITANKSTTGGGGLNVRSELEIVSTIIAGNRNGTAPSDILDSNASIDTDSDHNLLGVADGQTSIVNGTHDNQAGSVAAPLDALLGPLDDNGGATFTHLLLSGSPAGDNGANPDGLLLDQRGFDREVGASIDIGAVENDAIPPKALLVRAPDVNATSPVDVYNITVIFTDNQAIKASTLGDGDLLVTGPGGFSQLAQFVSTDVTGNRTAIVAVYRITPPGGTWDAADNGTYTIAMVSGEVTDVQGNGIAGVDLGTFTASLAPVVIPPLAPDGDTDGDGFTNEMEAALGTDPRNPASTPFNLGTPADGGALKVSSLMIHLDFAQAGKDSVAIKGALPIVNTQFALSGQTIILNVGGVVKAFTLDAKGKASSGSDSIAFKLGKKKGGTFSAALKNGSFASSLTDERLTADSEKGTRQVKAQIIVNNLSYQATVTKKYDPKKGNLR